MRSGLSDNLLLLTPPHSYNDLDQGRRTRLQYSSYFLSSLILICSVCTLLTSFLYFEIRSSVWLVSSIVYVTEYFSTTQQCRELTYCIIIAQSTTGVLVAIGFITIFYQCKHKKVAQFSLCSSILTLTKTCLLLVFSIQLILGVDISGFSDIELVGVYIQVLITITEALCVGMCVYLGVALKKLMDIPNASSEDENVSTFTSQVSPPLAKVSSTRCPGTANAIDSQNDLFSFQQQSQQNLQQQQLYVKPAQQVFFANCSVHSDSSLGEYLDNSIPNRKKITLHSVEALTVTVTESHATKSEGVSPDKNHRMLFEEVGDAYIETRDKSSSIPKRAQRKQLPRKSSTKDFSKTTIEQNHQVYDNRIGFFI